MADATSFTPPSPMAERYSALKNGCDSYSPKGPEQVNIHVIKVRFKRKVLPGYSISYKRCHLITKLQKQAVNVFNFPSMHLWPVLFPSLKVQ